MRQDLMIVYLDQSVVRILGLFSKHYIQSAMYTNSLDLTSYFYLFCYFLYMAVFTQYV